LGIKNPVSKHHFLLLEAALTTELIEVLLKIIGLPKVIAICKHDIKSFFFMILKLRFRLENEAFAALEILSQIRKHGLLDSLSDILHSPCNLSYEVILVHDEGCIGEHILGYLREIATHVAHEELDLEPFISWNGKEVTDQVAFIPVGKHIKYLVGLSVNENALVLAGICIALELVYAKDFRHSEDIRILNEAKDS